jgi:hypothetical protein
MINAHYMKNIIRFCLVFSFILATTVCFSQEKTNTTTSIKQTDEKVNVSTSKKDKKKKAKTPSSKEKNVGISNKIAVSDHGLPADKSGTKKSTDKAVLPKKQ